MTTELVLLLGIYAFIVIGVFLGDGGPIETFKKSAPRLAAKIERNVSVGYSWSTKGSTDNAAKWEDK
ncbi:hypothetical protein OAQ84_01145 [Bdellovibrionales bacterium]|nr:hypothetical protein [Bdellovibrionales bacterium]